MGSPIDKNSEVLQHYLTSPEIQDSSDLYIHKVTGLLQIILRDKPSASLQDWQILAIENQSGQKTIDSSCLAKLEDVARGVLQQTVDLLRLREKAEEVFTYAATRLQSPEPLDEAEIEQIHQLLFQPELEALSEREQDFYHPARVFEILMKGVAGLRADAAAKLSTEDEGRRGVNGSYFIKSPQGEALLLFKPEEEESSAYDPAVPKGAAAKREHVACLLNYDRIYPIPYTAYVRLGGQVGSVQLFEKDCQPLTLLSEQDYSRLPSRPFQASLIFDMRFGNLDRHLGNLLCRGKELFMIDHGACMAGACVPEKDFPLKLMQLVYPQMGEAWDEGLMQAISEMDIEKDRDIMLAHGMPERAIRRMENVSTFLKQAHVISLESRAEGISIVAYDVGLLVLKNSETFEDAKKTDVLVGFLNQVILCKKAFADPESVTSGKVFLARRQFVKVHPGYSDLLVSCLYGAQRGDDSPSRIDFEDSILGKHCSLAKGGPQP